VALCALDIHVTTTLIRPDAVQPWSRDGFMCSGIARAAGPENASVLGKTVASAIVTSILSCGVMTRARSDTALERLLRSSTPDPNFVVQKQTAEHELGGLKVARGSLQLEASPRTLQRLMVNQPAPTLMMERIARWLWFLLVLSLPLSRAYLLRAAGPVLSLHAPPQPAALRCLPSFAAGTRGRTRTMTRVDMAFDPMLSGVSTAVSALFFFAYETRPSGDLAVDEDLDVAPKTSTIANAGLGLFAARDLEAGTVLGTYPGRVWRADAWLRYKGLEPSDYLLEPAQRAKLQKERQARAEAYTWKLGKEFDSDEDASDPSADNTIQGYTATYVIDPTSATGELSDTVPWILNTFATLPTLLCRMNEPGPGGDVNVVAEETERSVKFVVERAVKAGEELFMDYGPYYDRSNYSPLLRPGQQDKVRDAVRTVLDTLAQQQPDDGGVPTWDYPKFLLAVEEGKVLTAEPKTILYKLHHYRPRPPIHVKSPTSPCV
jgi:hypothetical protein